MGRSIASRSKEGDSVIDNAAQEGDKGWMQKADLGGRIG